MTMAWVRRPGSTPKLVSTWTGPWQIIAADKVHVYGVQNNVTSEVTNVHVVRLRFYADKDLEMSVSTMALPHASDGSKTDSTPFLPNPFFCWSNLFKRMLL